LKEEKEKSINPINYEEYMKKYSKERKK